VPDRSKTPAPQSPFPSQELHDLLVKLGTLNDRHESLKELVEKLQVRNIKHAIKIDNILKNLIINEIKKLELMNVPKDGRPSSGRVSKIPDDFIQKLDEIKSIKAALEELKENFINVN
jgi:hypothetical protein